MSEDIKNPEDPTTDTNAVLGLQGESAEDVDGHSNCVSVLSIFWEA